MKRAVLIFLAVYGTVSANSEPARIPLRIGTGPQIGSAGAGISARLWASERFGISIQAGSTFDRTQEGGEVLAHYKFPLPTALQPYLFTGGGIRRIDIADMSPPKTNVPLGTVSAGIGAEAFLGVCKRHGLSIEGTWRSGAVEYRSRSETVIGDENQHSTIKRKELEKWSARLLYHFYFVPWCRSTKQPEAEPVLTKTAMEPVTLEVPPAEPEPAVEELPVVEESKIVDEELKDKPVLSVEQKAVEDIPAQMITFGANNSTLALSAIPVLQQLVDTLRAYPDLRIRVEGHTDSSGNAAKNQQLSIDRAERVKLFLSNSGIDSGRIETEGFGADRPKGPNDTFDNRKKNRRVEIIPLMDLQSERDE